jgi:hypothetical protein
MWHDIPFGVEAFLLHLRFEVFTAVIMKNAVFWDARRVALVRTDVSEELSASFIRVTRIDDLGTTLAVTMRGLLVTASVVPRSPILVPLMKEALLFSATSVLTRATRRNIQKTSFFIPPSCPYSGFCVTN